VRQGREWRVRNNEEIDNIIRKKDIIRFVKLDRSRRKNGGQQNAQDSDERENLHQEKKG
jgi:hypothetical protein